MENPLKYGHKNGNWTSIFLWHVIIFLFDAFQRISKRSKKQTDFKSRTSTHMKWKCWSMSTVWGQRFFVLLEQIQRSIYVPNILNEVKLLMLSYRPILPHTSFSYKWFAFACILLKKNRHVCCVCFQTPKYKKIWIIFYSWL